mgnify:CR=1 FL=1
MEPLLLFLNVAQQTQNLLLLFFYLVNLEIPAYWLAANKQQGNHQKEKEEQHDEHCCCVAQCEAAIGKRLRE